MKPRKIKLEATSINDKSTHIFPHDNFELEKTHPFVPFLFVRPFILASTAQITFNNPMKIKLILINSTSFK